MKTLNLKLQGGSELNAIIELDGNAISYKRNKYKTGLISYKTEKDYVDIEIKNALEIKGPVARSNVFLYYIFIWHIES